MPELPEVETVRRSLEPHLLGRTIQALRVGAFTGVLGGEDPEIVASRLVGRRFVDTERRGKYLLFRLDDGSTLVAHLRMTGRLLLAAAAEPPVRFEHLAIVLDDGNELRFADQRKFGRVLHVPADADLGLDHKIGPEPLGRDFTAAGFLDRLRRRSGPIKGALLDQRLVAGVGNIYADEALFRARLHPRRPARSLTPDEARRLHGALRDVLREGITNRGTTFSSFQNGHGEPGANQGNLRVYGRGRLGEPCPRCGTPISRIVVAGRGTHFCPRCQPAPAAPAGGSK